MQRDKVEVLANHAGERTTPTLVAYQDSDIVGFTYHYIASCIADRHVLLMYMCR